MHSIYLALPILPLPRRGRLGLFTQENHSNRQRIFAPSTKYVETPQKPPQKQKDDYRRKAPSTRFPGSSSSNQTSQNFTRFLKPFYNDRVCDIVVTSDSFTEEASWRLSLSARFETLREPAAANQKISSHPISDICASFLDTLQQQQYNDDQDNKSNSAAWSIAPTPAVRPSWQRTKKYQNQEHEENCTEHFCIPSAL
jgi:hypothetical protein